MSGLGLYLGFEQNQNQYKYQWKIPNTVGLVSMPNGITFSCASTRTAQTSPSTLLTGIGANQAVVSYNAYLDVYGLQHEATARNYQIYSEALQSWGVQSGGVISTGNADPSSGTNATLVAGNSIGSQFIAQALPSLSAANGLTTTSWIRGFNGTPNQADWCYGAAAVPQILNCEFPTPSLLWQRKSVSATNAGSVTGCTLAYSGVYNVGSNGQNNKAYYYGIQIETGLIPTSYIPTTTAATTRAASTISAPIANRLNFKCRFDLYVHNRTDYGTDSKTVFQDTSGTNKLLIYISTGTGVLETTKLTMLIDGVQVYVGTNPYPFVAGEKWSWRLTFDGTTYSCQVYKNDVLQWIESYTGAAPSSLTGIYFGSGISGINHWNSQVTFIGAT